METAGYELTSREAAAILNVHPRTLKRWVREEKVPAWRTPGGHLRYRRADLDTLVTTGLGRAS